MTTNRIIYRMILLLALMIGTEVQKAAATIPPRYHVTDLGTLGGEYSVALAINASGQVTGHSQTTANANTNAFLWTPATPNGVSGTMHDLGRLGGQISAGRGINAGGQVVGNTDGDPRGAFLWTPTTPGGTTGSMVGLGTLGGSYSEARGINAGGQVTGYSNTTGDSADHVFLWAPTTPGGTSGSMLDLGTLGGRFSVGNGINDSGQVTGTSATTEDAQAHAFLWIPATPAGANGTMLDLGTLGGTDSEGWAINASGQVTGNALTTDAAYHAFLWTPTTPGGDSGTMLDLGTLGGELSQGYGINASGQVVGYSQVIVGDVVRQHAFLYTSESGMVDLNTLVDPLFINPQLGWELQVAWAINDLGQIAVGGYFRDGLHTFLLTPVPEPASMLLFALAAMGLALAFSWREHRCALSHRRLLATSIVLLAGTGPARAAMLNATSVAELISAINAANQNAGPDSISLAAGSIFTLTEVNNSTHGATGLPAISSVDGLTIIGNGSIIERSAAAETPAFRLFDVAAEASLALENLTLQGGFTNGYSPLGGAIYNVGALALSNVTVQSNIARGKRGDDCRCRTSPGGPGWPGQGGGIYSSGSLRLENSVLRNNQAQGGGGGSGPGGLGRGGDGQGGGLYVAAGSATLYNSLVTGNSAVGGFGSPPGVGLGGGIFIASALVGLDERTLADVTNNTASTNYPDIYGPYDLISNSSPLPGDYNEDGTVDAADYIVWRKTDGTQAGYDAWRAHFGTSRGVGSGVAIPSATPLSAAVPEPATIALVVLGLAGLATANKRSGRQSGKDARYSITFRRRSILLLALALAISLECSTRQSFAGLVGPTPYLQASDSPFATTVFDYFYLEDFEDNLFNVPGVTKTVSSIIGQGLAVDSVDADDGIIDGSGNDGHSLRTVGFTPASVTFTFDASVLGALPTHAGIVWTDGGTGTVFEAFGAGMASLGTIGPFNFSDGNPNGGTAEDRFFGWSDLSGILAIKISPSGASMEVDHLQYGFATIVPEPGSFVLVGIGMAAIGVFNRRRACVARSVVVLWFAVSCGRAYAVDMDWVTVGNPGNPADTFNETYGRAWGGVNYAYRIGKYEVTNTQYAEFLNAKAAMGDPLQLFDTQMSSVAIGGINRSGGGTAGDPYVYTVKSGRGNNPVVFVSWYDALRFANWLNNGQGSGDTESGSYTLLGGTPLPSNAFPYIPPIARNPGARVVLPSEDEWYKAAYHKNDGVTGNYWDYPTATDEVPFSDQPPGTDAPTPSNTANQPYSDGIANNYDDGYAATGSSSFSDTQNYLTDAGAYTQSLSPYGTFDQAGNASEWTETLWGDVGYYRVLRGGDWGCCFGSPGGAAVAWSSGGDGPELNFIRYGFRVAMVPEPGSLLLAVTGLGLLAASSGRIPGWRATSPRPLTFAQTRKGGK